MTHFDAEAVVVDAGAFPSAPQALEWLKRGLPVVCCDGAADEFIAGVGEPWRIVGDCDSLSALTRRLYGPIIRRIPDQDTNDQTKAVGYLAAKGLKRIVILGATGRREDHTLGNLSLLMSYLNMGVTARAYTDYGVFIPAEGYCRFHCRQGAQVSVFSFGATELRSDGLKWGLRDFDELWQGTLNEALSTEFAITARGRYLVFITYQPKRPK